ncbi:hypothetical protein IFU40_12030 [Microbacterium sp. CFBP 13617]|uniref:hypothetical protein n=1 Tax=Microbacterium sp. CFBP 13617 TaxID=2774035 RepID=UPI00177DC1BF|nr:hypothetical protein [Microbacterium sp. CFBP 13617]MBD8219362.1 hypothetical protein [Microbacterium sp. CFBP 13617]
MRILLDEPKVDVSYCSASITTDEGVDRGDLGAPWVDESNGLCGAGIPGVLELVTGTHTGRVSFRVELHDSEPAVDPMWEEVVEVSFTTELDEAFLTGLMGDEFPFPLPRGDYRVRYCAQGFGEAHNSDEAEDSYLLQFWLAPPAPGRILVQTSAEASYWHRTRRTLGLEEMTEQELAEVAERQERGRLRWGDRVPNARLLELVDAGMPLSALTELDVDLEFALAEADDVLHRRIAAWAALRCLDASGLSALPLYETAVHAFRHGDPAPPPFDELRYGWDVLEWSRPVRTRVPAPLDGESTESPQEWATRTLMDSTGRDSLIAVLNIVVCLAYVHGRDGYREAFDDLRAQFPDL